MSSSGPYFSILLINGLTVSYRPFIEAFCLPAVYACLLTGAGMFLPAMSWGMLMWAVCLVFYGILGLTVSAISGLQHAHGATGGV